MAASSTRPRDAALAPRGKNYTLSRCSDKLPVKVVIFNNSAFGLITLEAESVGLPPFRKGIEFPNPDFAAFASACGGHGFAARKPSELHWATI
jgi:pyruvate dehydrogenase (quinone)